ncbi:MAG: alpha-L-glutamate ligase, partial [Alphaproteobacteria bacterium]
YIRAPQPFITRCEFIGGRFVYAVRVDTRDGFELCPADACAVEDTFCPADAPAAEAPSSGGKFTVLPDFTHPVLECYARFLRDNRIEVAGIEFIIDEAGELFTYDVNTNTNYNQQAEAAAGIAGAGMSTLARFLGEELRAGEQSRAVAAAE